MNKIGHVIRLLNSNKVEVKLVYLKGLWGLCDYEDSELFINKRLGTTNQVKTLIHECLHFLNPEGTEKEVLAWEKEVYDTLSFEETNFLRDFLRSKEK